MIDVLERCFSEQLNGADWQQKIKMLVPSYGESLIENADLLKQVRLRTLSTLKLL
jgi:malate dehydrogenase (quinone)